MERVPRGHHGGAPGKLVAAAVAFFAPDPQVAEGCAPEDYWEDPVEVWPECRGALGLFVALETQWNAAIGIGGGKRLGLRYEAVYPLLDRATEGDREEWDSLFGEIRHMEQAVLRIPGKAL
ncbi:DUF1799 domain-containing protein [Pantoea sp. 18069]|uniref:DUF1799 domain-containing protein n=1 Tax=Pantoea sp. 18069 TaxID=2681415 RepID=UPI001359789E|nr:DUF1799 domain-containing protein [Pantoea sp. 18069]